MRLHVQPRPRNRRRVGHWILLFAVLMALVARQFHAMRLVVQWETVAAAVDRSWDAPFVPAQQQQQQQHGNKTHCVVIRTVYPIHNLTRRLLQDLQQGLPSNQYDIIVRVDLTSAKKLRIPIRLDLPSATVSTITLQELSQAYPVLPQYLYNKTANQDNNTGSCCLKADMWQLCVPNDVHFFMEHSYEYVWVVEDDTSLVPAHTSLARLLHNIDQRQPHTPFIGLPYEACRNPFVKHKHTHAFYHDIIQGHPHMPRFCIGENLRRFSRQAATAVHEALHRFQFAWAESFVQPVLTAAGVPVSLWSLPSFAKITPPTALDCYRNHSQHFSEFLYHYGKKNENKNHPCKWQFPTSPKRLIVTIGIETEESITAFADNYRAHYRALQADWVIVTSQPLSTNMGPVLKRARARVVTLPYTAAAQGLVDYIRGQVPFLSEDQVLLVMSDAAVHRGDVFSILQQQQLGNDEATATAVPSLHIYHGNGGMQALASSASIATTMATAETIWLGKGWATEQALHAWARAGGTQDALNHLVSTNQLMVQPQHHLQVHPYDEITKWIRKTK